MNKKIPIYLLLLFIFNSLIAAQNSFHANLEIEKIEDSRRVIATVNKESQIVLKLEKTLTEDSSIPTVIAMSDGNLALLNSLEGNFELYNQSSELFFADRFYNLGAYKEQSIIYYVNKNGINLLVSEDRKNSLYFISNDGESEFVRNCEDGLITGLSTSSNGEELFYSIINWDDDKLDKKCILYNRTSENVTRFEVDFEIGLFNESDNIFSGHNKKTSFCINVTTKILLWKKPLGEKEFYLDIDFFENNTVLVKSNSPELINGQWIYNGAGIIQKNILGEEKELYRIEKSFKTIEVFEKDNNLGLKLDSEVIVEY